jgi:hypothetical protein
MMSPLDDAELRKLASELDLEFLDELRDLLLSLPLRGRSYGPDSLEDSKAPVHSLADTIYDRAKSRRLSKDRVYAYMRDADSRAAKEVPRGALSLRDAINEFVVRSAPESANRLLGLVSGQPEQDAYLVGITARK